MYLVGGDDEARVYRDLGKAINGLRQSAFDQFWGCALQGEDLRDVHNNTELIAKLDGRGRERGRAYAIHLREACLPLLEPIGPKLDTLIAPPDVSASIQALKDANSKLRSAASGFISYLDDPELDYDEATARPHLDAIARGWYDYKKASSTVNDLIREKIKP
jgi:hypothetical protein